VNAPDWRSSNAADAILAARAHDERPALIDLMRTGADATSNAGVAVSYARLVELVEAATRELRALGLARDGGEVPRVCLAGANGTTYVIGTTTREVWHYERGYGKLPATLTFSEGVLKEIRFGN